MNSQGKTLNSCCWHYSKPGKSEHQKSHTGGNIHWDQMTRLHDLTSLSSLVYFGAWMKATARALGLHEQEHWLNYLS